MIDHHPTIVLVQGAKEVSNAKEEKDSSIAAGNANIQREGGSHASVLFHLVKEELRLAIVDAKLVVAEVVQKRIILAEEKIRSIGLSIVKLIIRDMISLIDLTLRTDAVESV